MRRTEVSGEGWIARSCLRLLWVSLALAFLLPFVWMLSASLQPEGQALGRGLLEFPDGLRFSNYPTALAQMGSIGRLFFNTLLLTLLSIVGQVLSCSLAGYALARLRFPGRQACFLLVLATMMLPPQVLAIPQFLLFRQLGLIDTFWPILLPAFLGGAPFSPFFIFLFRQHFLTIPLELSEAARIDGCGFFATWWRVILPLSRPVVGSVAVFTFLWTWNDFWTPLIYLNAEENQTLTLALATFNASYRVAVEWLMAATVVVLLPCLLVYFLAQRFFLRGLDLRGAKG